MPNVGRLGQLAECQKVALKQNIHDFFSDNLEEKSISVQELDPGKNDGAGSNGRFNKKSKAGTIILK